MAVPTGTTVAGSSLAKLIPTEIILGMIQEPGAVGVPVFGTLGWEIDASNMQGAVVRIPREDGLTFIKTEASPLTEADTGGFGDALEVTTSEEAVTAVRVGGHVSVSYEAFQDAGQELGWYLRQLARAMTTRINVDWLLNTKNAGASYKMDYSATAFGVEAFETLVAGYRAQVAPGVGVDALVLSETQLETLKKSVRLNKGTIGADPRFGGDIFNMNRGFVGAYEGVPLFASTDVAAEDASNRSGAMLRVGDMGAIALVNKWRPGAPRVPDGVLPNGYLFEYEREPNEGSFKVYCSARYGTAISHPAKLREIISLAA